MGHAEKIKFLSRENFSEERYKKAVEGIENIILLSGESDPKRQGLEDTPNRVVKAFLEYTVGYSEDPARHLEKVFDVTHNEIVLVKDIEFVSLCEHHFAPFFGVAHVAYIPDKKVTGLSKIARMVDGYAKRFQVQEALTQQIADAMELVLKPKGVAVIIEAKHTCMCYRGVGKTTASTTTSAMRGCFMADAASRNELLTLIKK